MFRASWESLETAGPCFQEPYHPVGVEVAGAALSPMAEEMLWDYCRFWPDSEYRRKPVFDDNVYSCLKWHLMPRQRRVRFPAGFKGALDILKKKREEDKASRDAWRASHKAQAMSEADKRRERYGFALRDGVREPLMSYIVERGGIMVARGESKELGLWKYGAGPEDVVINCSVNPPSPPAGHAWRAVECNRGYSGAFKYFVRLGGDGRTGHVRLIEKDVRFAPTSSVGSMSDAAKFDLALRLRSRWGAVATLIRDGCLSEDVSTRECCIAAWVIMVTAIRVGGSSAKIRGNGCLGVTTLLKENVSVTYAASDDGVTEASFRMSFVGKDSVPFDNSYTFTEPADVRIVLALGALRDSRADGAGLFSVSSSDVNAVLDGFMHGLTAKAFRPAKGSGLLADALCDAGVTRDMAETSKVMAFHRANKLVAELLNHKRAVPKAFKESVTRRKAALKNRRASVKAAVAKIDAKIRPLRAARRLPKVSQETLEALEARRRRLLDGLAAAEELLSFKMETSQEALSTSLANYIDPRLVYSWCADVGLDINRLYTKSQRAKFSWAETADAEYWCRWVAADRP